MEKFKAVEKEMKTKAFSKEGLSAAAKLDPKEKDKLGTGNFLSSMVEELERQLETLEAEEDSLQVTAKKSKKDTAKADRLAEISRLTERHKWHQGKLELLLRSLENGNVEPEQVRDLQEGIEYYVKDNQAVEFMEDDTIYDDLNLEEDEGAFGMANELDHVSSQDAQSTQDDIPESADGRAPTASTGKPKSGSISESQGSAARRPSNQSKSPLPALATLHTPLANVTNHTVNNSMKPAPLPTRGPGETLKYASAAAAAAAASDKNAVGIAPLPPPPNPGIPSTSNATGLSTIPPSQGAKSSTTSSPSVAASLPASSGPTPALRAAIPVAATVDSPTLQASEPKSPPHTSGPPSIDSQARRKSLASPSETEASISSTRLPPIQTSSNSNFPSQPEQTQKSSSGANISGTEQTNRAARPSSGEDESIYHLPPGLQDLIQSFEQSKANAPSVPSPAVQRYLASSQDSCPDGLDAEKPRYYRPQTKFNTPPYYPQEPLAEIENPSLYSKIDTDTLFYIFYYRQNTFLQYLAAKSLKSQSWRFHKQYQTWFQRHEEPKTITEEFEQGTYRFFDYESTWSAKIRS